MIRQGKSLVPARLRNSKKCLRGLIHDVKIKNSQCRNREPKKKNYEGSYLLLKNLSSERYQFFSYSNIQEYYYLIDSSPHTM